MASGDSLFREGDPARAIFEVLAGRILLVRHTPGGQRILLQTAGPGDLLAEAALFAARYHCDAVTAAASEIRVIPKPALLGALRDDPELSLAFLGTLAHQVQALRGRLALRELRPARERVLAALTLYAGPGGRTVRLPGTMKDFAAEIGLSHEALYRTLAALVREGRITRVDEKTLQLISRSG